ncbi:MULTISPECIES: hypothetical protein [unclassified Acinetobacter]|uniref:hypothetical protein n=1 Tax=unclassified Acinetobacter TaxID=196816 RepID=UPI0019095FA3|nr:MULTISPECIES: hypothetical protein [unclassified Acinetobacter]MBK0062386.1 hypothetical protein [Acinetobacter sp. S55]MBK0066190.1 hypothetical protein [Acinetobacter sp. S54]
MNIPSNWKTPGTYIDINLNAQRTGLPANIHKILFLTNDLLLNESEASNVPLSIYDKAGADVLFGENSEAGRMITAAIKVNKKVDVQCLGKSAT